MPKNCLEEYLTEGCPTCPDWADGTDDRGIGCATRWPIMECPHFAKMYNEEEAKKRLCKNCARYEKCEKICRLTSKHTARKNTCQDFTWWI